MPVTVPHEGPVSMLFAALVACAALAHCEWVEISQHYHRPRKPTHYTNTTYREHGWGQIPDNWPQTTNEYDTQRWSRRPDKNDIPGERRPTSETPEEKRITVAPTNFSENSGEVTRTEVPIAFVKEGLGPTRAIIEKVSNIGSIKRVQLSNTPIKSPTIKISNISDRKPKPVDTSNTPVNNQESDEFVINANIFKDSYEEEMSIPHTNNRKPNYNKGRPNTNVDHTNPDDSQSDFNISKDTKPKLDHNIHRKINKLITKEKGNIINSNITETINDSDKKVKNVENQITNTDKDNNNINRLNKKSFNDQNDQQFSIETNKEFKYPDDEIPTQNDKSNEFKVNTMENILKFMKVVTETISKNVRRGVNGKVKYLSELKDSLLQNIKYRIDACWPDDSPAELRGRRRGSREATDTARGHVEFPSSDSALMTISFLTFAVFLIKLVLQVIQAYKHKAMIMAPVMVATAGRRRLSRKEGKH